VPHRPLLLYQNNYHDSTGAVLCIARIGTAHRTPPRRTAITLSVTVGLDGAFSEGRFIAGSLPCFLITVSINEIGGLMNEGGNVPVTVTVNLPKQAVEAVQRLAKKRHTTATEILRHAISLEKQVDDELDHGTNREGR
jgi:hypothetical protein